MATPTKTPFARKLDSLGRLVLPSKLREELGITVGDTYEFYIIEEDGKVYLAIECPGANAEVEKAKQILRDAGFEI